jgi:hypothetical protein
VDHDLLAFFGRFKERFFDLGLLGVTVYRGLIADYQPETVRAPFHLQSR